MLATQVEYWKLQETKRHNLKDESIRTEGNDIGWVNADANQKTASANLQNADTNIRNAATNERNAAVNERNASTNEENARTNKRNAEINAENAESNKIQAVAATKQAANSALQAQAAWKNAESQAKQTYYNTEEQGFLKDVALTRQAQKQANLNEEKEMTERTMRPLTAEKTKAETAEKWTGIAKDIAQGLAGRNGILGETRAWISAFTK